MSQDWNGVRFAGGNHVESYFLKAVDPQAQRALWLKATIFAREAVAGLGSVCLAEAWAIAFDHRDGARRHVAAKHQVPFGEASFARERLDVRWPGPRSEYLALQDGRTRGEVGQGDERIRWDLRFPCDDRPSVTLPLPRMYTGPFPSSKTVTPHPDLRFDGEIEAAGMLWTIKGWRGMQGHNWGRGHAERYAWSQCNQWEGGEDFVLEAVSARVRGGPFLLPVLTLVTVRHRGVDYELNAPVRFLRHAAQIDLRRHTFTAEGRFARVEGEVEADTDDFVGLYYANPSGPMTHCLNTKLARARVRFEAEGRPPLVLSSQAAALEIGTRRRDHGVRMYV